MDEPIPNLENLPLFGNREAQPRGRCVNTVIIILTVLLVFFTAISAFISGVSALDLFFVVCIVLFCISNLTLIMWYRVGDLDPKFKILIYYNTLCIVLTCICGNIFFHT